MKKLSLILAITCIVVLFITSTAAAATLPPRWPSPEWYAQFRTKTQPAPQPVQVTPAPTTGTVETPQATTLTAAEKVVFDGINKARVQRGLNPLTLNPELVRLARLKSKDMGVNNYFAHRSPTYGSAYDMMRQAGIRYSYAGENLAKTTSAHNAVQLFLNSSSHRSTLLNPNFNQTGVGIYQVGRQIYVTQMFIKTRY